MGGIGAGGGVKFIDGGGVIVFPHGPGGSISRPLVSCWSLARLQLEAGPPCDGVPLPT